jgi:hypothetical protein
LLFMSNNIGECCWKTAVVAVVAAGIGNVEFVKKYGILPLPRNFWSFEGFLMAQCSLQYCCLIYWITPVLIFLNIYGDYNA